MLLDGLARDTPSILFVKRISTGLQCAQHVAFHRLLGQAEMRGSGALAHAVQSIEEERLPARGRQAKQGQPDLLQLLPRREAPGGVCAAVFDVIAIRPVDMDAGTHGPVVITVSGKVGASAIEPGAGVIRRGSYRCLQQAHKAFLNQILGIVGAAPGAQIAAQVGGIIAEVIGDAAVIRTVYHGYRWQAMSCGCRAREVRRAFRVFSQI